MSCIKNAFEKIRKKIIKYDPIDENTTSTHTPRRVKNDRKLPRYKIIEVDNISKKRSKYRMKHYLAREDSYYPVPGLVYTNILGKCCRTMVPQGICKMDSYLLITAYDSEGGNNSVIYVMDDNYELKATLVYDKKCHMGGIAYDGKYIWIAEGGKRGLGAICKEDILGAIKVSEEKNARSVLLKNIIWQQVSELAATSYCTFYDNRLWIGEFDKNTESHIYGYSIDYSRQAPSIIPERYIRAPKRTQGICFVKSDETVLLGVSISYGRYNNSSFNYYKLDEYSKSDYYKSYNNRSEKKDEILIIDKGEAYKTMIMPPMSEQFSMDGEMLYCIFESGARKYLMNMDGYGYARRPIGSCIIFDRKRIFHTN